MIKFQKKGTNMQSVASEGQGIVLFLIILVAFGIILTRKKKG